MNELVALRPNQTRTAALDQAIDTALNDRRIVGCVVLLAEAGEIVYRRAAGKADREAGHPMTPETPLRLASISKPLTTMAALKLAEAGQLSPEDPVSHYLPAFRLKMADGRPAAPTVSHLMAHMAGLDYRFQQPADRPYARAGVSDGLDRGAPSLLENLRRIASVPLDITPGSAWRYSVATDVLGAVVEAVTGQSLDKAIAELVTGPLGLDIRFRWPEEELATPYYDAEPEPLRMSGVTEVPLSLFEGPGVRFDPGRIGDGTAWPSGGAGTAGRARDVLKLLEAYRTGSFLSAEWREKARKPRIGAEAQAQGPGWGYSWLGAVLIDAAAAASRWSAGSVAWGGAYGASWGIDLNRKLTLVSLTNTAFEGMFGQFAQEIASAAVEASEL